MPDGENVPSQMRSHCIQILRTQTKFVIFNFYRKKY